MNDRDNAIRALGYGPEVVAQVGREGCEFEVFASYHRHISDIDLAICVIEMERDLKLSSYRQLLYALTPNGATDTTITGLMKLPILLVVSAFVMCLTIPTRVACWRARRTIQRQLCPNFREWMRRQNQGT